MKFYLDNMLTRVAKWLRLMGIDTTIMQTTDTVLNDPQGVYITGSIKHYLNWPVERKLYLEEDQINQQLNLILLKFLSPEEIRPFSRCSICNAKLTAIDKEQIRALIPGRVAENFKSFKYCQSCRKVYWQGSHFDRINAVFRKSGIAK